ncbi:hypothetical protein LCGC14_1204640 [marine sediment metagenome]|uniref:Uncharacterized protein n=1 Tax=marine sediment metagenome TaxID=412755 RepID=A0A0F9LFX3_9ZZZZ
MAEKTRETIVCGDRTLITIDGSDLEIRGNGWGPRRHKSDPITSDRVRRARLDSHSQAVKVARLLKEMLDE